MKKLIILIIGILSSVSIFSQSSLKVITNKPKIIVDSTGMTLTAFDDEQTNFIIKELKTSSINKKLIIELEKQIVLLKERNLLLNAQKDNLNHQIEIYTEIKINLEGQIKIQEKKIEEFNKNINDYKLIGDNLNKEVEIYKKSIKRKNGWIGKLAIANIITTTLLILILL